MAMNSANVAGSAGGLAAGPRPKQPEVKALKELCSCR
jgi:hypothetical protein